MSVIDKKTLRRDLLRKRLSLSNTLVSLKSQAITNHLLAIARIREKNNFSCYLSINNEVDTTIIIDSLIQKGVNIFVPTYSKTTNNYQFSRFGGWQDLEEGPQRILQPKDTYIIDPSLIGVAILPGLAFSKEGVRLGYGKGVFDRLLAGSTALKIGLAYEFQIIDGNIPKEKHDLLMDLIVTEKKVYRF